MSSMKTTYAKAYRELLARLKEARLAAGLKQAEVAKRLGQHQSFISKIEAGERRLDPIELKRFAKIYKVTISWLLDESGNAPLK